MHCHLLKILGDDKAASHDMGRQRKTGSSFVIPNWNYLSALMKVDTVVHKILLFGKIIKQPFGRWNFAMPAHHLYQLNIFV